jgi:CHAD domain-containing protein
MTKQIRGSTPMTVAGAVILRRHFEELLLHEPGARKGEDPEEVHRMRVASRRMRAALRLFKDHLDRDLARTARKRLRLLAQLLGSVRDLDVYRTNLIGYQSESPSGVDAGLDALLSSADDAWTLAHLRFVDHLERRSYIRFQDSCDHLIVASGGDKTGVAVSEAAPGVIWDRYDALIRRGAVANDHTDPATLHRVRMAAKRLRYSLKSFDGVFGPGTGPILTELRLGQDHLGALNDALVATRFTACYLATGSVAEEGPTSVAIPAPAVGVYIAHTQQLALHLIDTFPSMWNKLSSEALRDDMADAIGGD